MQDNQQLEIPRIQLSTLYLQLQQLLKTANNTEQWRAQFLQLIIALTNAVGAAFVIQNFKDNKEVYQLETRILSKQVIDWHPQFESNLIQVAQMAIQQQRVIWQSTNEQSYQWFIAIPLQRAQRCDALTVMLVNQGQPLEWFITILQLLASYTLVTDLSSPERTVLRWFPALLSQPHLNQARQAIVHTLQQQFACQRVFLGGLTGQHYRLLEVSGQQLPHNKAELVHVLESLMDEAGLKGHYLNNQQLATQPLISRLLHLTHSQTLLVIPLVYQADSRAEHVLILLWEQGTDAQALAMLQVAGAPLGAALHLFKRRTSWQQYFAWLWQPRWKKWVIGLVPLILIVILSIPVSHRLEGQVLINPSVRRFVTAPFEGMLKKTFKEAGDLVKEGDVLAVLDEREIEWTLTGLNADRNRARKQKDASAATKETAAMQMAQLEIERLDVQIALYEYRAANLEIKSPIAGIVISGDLKRAEGSPVSSGQSLFEVAPLDKMLIELAVPAKQAAYLQTHLPMEIQLDAYPEKHWQVETERIQPRATLREGQNVFICEATLNNEENKLRPGMKGNGVLLNGKKALGWVLFYPLWEDILRWWR